MRKENFMGGRIVTQARKYITYKILLRKSTGNQLAGCKEGFLIMQSLIR